MASRMQVSLDCETHQHARRRASQLGVSLAEYFRRLVSRDLAGLETNADVDRIFDLGDSGGSDFARNKTEMIAGAMASSRKRCGNC